MSENEGINRLTHGPSNPNRKQAALVTGSSRGIGAAVAKRLAKDGFRVVVNYLGSAPHAQETVNEIIANGGEAIMIQADIVDPRSVAEMLDNAEQAFGRLNAVVNNAGIMKLMPLEEMSDGDFDQIIATNLKGTFNVCREAAKRLDDGARIINLSSSVIGMRLPSYGAYIASKAGVEGLTQVLAQEMRGRGIRVNAVAPGPTATELFLDGKSDELIGKLTKMNPLETLGEPEDIAGVIAFLAGPEGAWINGQVLRANGGMC